MRKSIVGKGENQLFFVEKCQSVLQKHRSCPAKTLFTVAHNTAFAIPRTVLLQTVNYAFAGRKINYKSGKTVMSWNIELYIKLKKMRFFDRNICSNKTKEVFLLVCKLYSDDFVLCLCIIGCDLLLHISSLHIQRIG